MDAKTLNFQNRTKIEILEAFAPESLKKLDNRQTTIPKLAKDKQLLDEVETVLPTLPTSHKFFLADSVRFNRLEPESIHLVLTSPPYWTLKRYNEIDHQLGHMSNYDAFVKELNKIWRKCYKALVPGGRVVCVVGDVCLSRRKNNGRHVVVPLHASIQEGCRNIGYDNVATIIWNKIANANYEVEGGSSFLGKPYEPNAVIKNDVEYILMERKPGGYRKPTFLERCMSVISAENYQQWNVQIWNGLTGASTRKHPAPYPLELANRLIRMYSFVGDTVFDPFLGSGTTAVASAKVGRNSIGVELAAC